MQTPILARLFKSGELVLKKRKKMYKLIILVVMMATLSGCHLRYEYDMKSPWHKSSHKTNPHKN